MRLFLLLLLACAAAAAPVARPAPAPAHTRGTPAPALADAQLERAIRAKLLKSKISADGFQVRVQGGVTTFEGHTDILQHKGTATRLAHNAGAGQVLNKIQVSQAARDKASATSPRAAAARR